MRARPAGSFKSRLCDRHAETVVAHERARGLEILDSLSKGIRAIKVMTCLASRSETIHPIRPAEERLRPRSSRWGI